MFDLSDSQRRNIMIALVTAVILGAVGYGIYLYSRPKLLTQIRGGNNDNQDNQETEGGTDAEIIFFFADWCPHCKKAKPHWEEVKQMYSGKVVNGYNMIFTEVDCSEETDEVKQTTKQYDIEGYPTIKLVKDGQVIEYDAKPDKDTLEKFINTVI